MQAPPKTSCVQMLIFALIATVQQLPAQTPATEFTTDTGPWASWLGATVDLTNHPGFAHVTQADDAFGGLQLTGGVPVTNYPPPWHFEIAFERPTDINTAVGILIQSDGLQALFPSLNNGTPGGFGSAAGIWGSGKNFTAVPDFSGVLTNKMEGK